jgi:hypothetical protein
VGVLFPNEAAIYEGARLRGREGDERSFARELESAAWAGDIDQLHELAPCDCCCDEHTFGNCPARAWGGCRGQNAMTREDERGRQRHYEQFHNMTEDQFYGLERR